jgi:hypothetical protein
MSLNFQPTTAFFASLDTKLPLQYWIRKTRRDQPAQKGKIWEETLFSDHVISIAGRSFTITSHDMLMMLVSVVTGLLFFTALYFSRKRIVVLKRSSGTDQLTFELSRIADALDRISYRPADDAIAAASRRQQQIQPPPQPESKGVPYSILGR